MPEKKEQGVAPEKGVAPLELRKIQRKEFRARCRSAGAEENSEERV